MWAKWRPMSAAVESSTPKEEVFIKHPWAIFPLLYLMQAMPVHIVQDVSTLVYKDMGLPNAEIVRWTSLIALPWSMQFLLGPLVDFNATKRRWILGAQAIICGCLILAAFMLGMKEAFQFSLAVLGIAAITSALCNIATDGFFIISQTKTQQTAMAAVQTTFYRFGRLLVTWLMVKTAGGMIENGALPATAWKNVLIAAAIAYFVGYLINLRQIPVVPSDAPKEQLEPDQNKRNIKRVLLIVLSGIGSYFAANALVRLIAHGIFQLKGGDPQGPWKGWMLQNPVVDGNVMPVRWGPVFSPFSPVMSEVVQLGVCAVIAVVAITWVRKLLVKTEMGFALSSFFQQPGIAAILVFVLFYRFPEAMVGKMTPLFYKDPITAGGLALTTENVGDIKGLFSVLGIILGGIIGGWVVHKLGLRKAFWIVALAMHTPNLLYMYLSYNVGTYQSLGSMTLPLIGVQVSEKLAWLVGIELIDQAGYGIGYAAYFVYLMQVAQRGKHITTHYAIASGLGALCIALAGILGGIFQSNFGWHGFFFSVIVLGVPALCTLLIIPMDKTTGAATASS